MIHLTSPHLTSSDLISSQLSAPCLVAATANLVVCCEATQLAAAATNRNALSSDELRSAEMRTDEVRRVIRTLPEVLKYSTHFPSR